MPTNLENLKIHQAFNHFFKFLVNHRLRFTLVGKFRTKIENHKKKITENLKIWKFLTVLRKRLENFNILKSVIKKIRKNRATHFFVEISITPNFGKGHFWNSEMRPQIDQNRPMAPPGVVNHQIPNPARPPISCPNPPMMAANQQRPMSTNSGTTNNSGTSQSETRNKSNYTHRKFDSAHLDILLGSYAENAYPSTEEVNYLVSVTSLSFKQVRKWFEKGKRSKIFSRLKPFFEIWGTFLLTFRKFKHHFQIGPIFLRNLDFAAFRDQKLFDVFFPQISNLAHFSNFNFPHFKEKS